MNTQGKMYFMHLIAIVRMDMPDQTFSFREHADSWMKQWTVANNFKPVVTDDPNFALQMWWKEFEKTARSILGSSIPKHLDLAEQFQFKYGQSEVVLNQSFYLHDRVLYTNCEDIEIEEQEEVSITVMGAQGEDYRTGVEAEKAWNEGKAFVVQSTEHPAYGSIFSKSTVATLMGKLVTDVIIGTRNGQFLTRVKAK